MAGKGLFDKIAFATFWSQLKLKLGTHGGIVSGKGLSSNDYTTAEKEKLAGLDDRLGELEDSIDDIGSGFETVIISGSTASMSSSDIYQKHQNGIVIKCLCEFSDGRSLLLSLAKEPTESMARFSETTFGVADSIISEYIALVVGTVGSSSIVSTQFVTSDEASGSTTVTNYVPIVNGVSTDGMSYAATVDDFELVAGRMIMFIPARVSSHTSVTLTINGGDAKRIYQGTSYNTATKLTPATPTWLAANKPILLKYDGTYWITVEARAYANDMYGTLAVTKGGTGATTAETARTNLEVYSKTEVDDLITGLGSGDSSSSTTEPLVLTGNCYCTDEDIVSTTDTRLVFTVALSGSTAYDAYNTYDGVTTKRDIVIRLTNTYTPSALGTTGFEPIVYIEAPVYIAALNYDPATYSSTYGVKAVGTGYCVNPKYFYKVYIDYMSNVATVTIEKHSNDGTGTSGGSSGSVSFPTPTETPSHTPFATEAGWYYIAVIHNSVTYPLGQVYWDGASSVKIGCDSGYAVSFGAGWAFTYKDGNTLYDDHTVLVAKLS